MAERSLDIEAFLCIKLIRDFGISPDLVIWDSTSFYFEGAYADSELVTFGYAEDGKTDAKRVGIGMCIDAHSGIPLTTSREPGRKGDTQMVIENIETLRSTLNGANRDNYVVVADRALATLAADDCSIARRLSSSGLLLAERNGASAVVCRNTISHNV